MQEPITEEQNAGSTAAAGEGASSPKKDKAAASAQKKQLKAEKKMKRREIRRFLVGSYVTLGDGRLGAGSSLVTSQGFGDGAGSTIFLGIKEKRYTYTTRLKNRTQTEYKITNAMRDIGRMIYLETDPECPACYVRSVLFRPVVLRAETEGNPAGTVKIFAYCGRSPLAFLSVMRIISKFNKALPDDIKRA